LPAEQRQTLPDSVVVLTDEGDLLTRSAAAIYVLERLGGLWRVLGTVMRVVPRAVRDAAYDVVARTRYRAFGRRDTLCPILPPDLRSRFLE
jgi:predicted DCC family thiol-disulfide oxidoreductase YuxK